MINMRELSQIETNQSSQLWGEGREKQEKWPSKYV